MLSKLLKYEFKATARSFVPLYLALAVFTVFIEVINPFQVLISSASPILQYILSLLSIIAYYLLFAAVVAMTLLVMIQRFQKDLLGNEGYLMFTLPVHAWQHIVSKLVAAMVWTVLSFVVTAASTLIVSPRADAMEIMRQMVNSIRSLFGVSGFLVLPAFFLILLASGILIIYAAIALWHLFPKHKLPASFGMYLYIVSQFIIMFMLMVYMATLGQKLPLPAEGSVLQANLKLLLLSLPFILVGAVNYVLTNTILKKKLNLE